jgi:hypothetical protein
MIPGDDCPPHAVRYASPGSVTKLAARFGLPHHPGMQDWEVEVADFSRVPAFVAAYDDDALDADDRFTLMALALASLDEGAQEGHDISELWSGIEPFLRRDAALHATTLSYWACGAEEAPDRQFAVTRFIRSVWHDVRARVLHNE